MTEPTALSQLRHLYQNMVNGAVRDTASAKRIAEGLLAPAIAALERGTPAARAPADSVLEDADRYRWLFGARTDAQAVSVSETVFKPLPQDEVLSHLQGFYMSKTVVDALVDAARKQGANHD